MREEQLGTGVLARAAAPLRQSQLIRRVMCEYTGVYQVTALPIPPCYKSVTVLRTGKQFSHTRRRVPSPLRIVCIVGICMTRSSITQFGSGLALAHTDQSDLSPSYVTCTVLYHKHLHVIHISQIRSGFFRELDTTAKSPLSI